MAVNQRIVSVLASSVSSPFIKLLVLSLLAWALPTMEAMAQEYPMHTTVTNTTGTFSLAADPEGVTNYLDVTVNGVYTGRFAPPPVSLSGLSNGVYQYRYIQQIVIPIPGGADSIVDIERGVTVVTVSREAISPPGLLSLSGLTYPEINVDTDGSFTVHWVPAATAPLRYELERNLQGTSTWSTVYSGTSTSHTESLGDGSYFYRVRSCFSSGCSAYTSGIVATVTLPPAPPSLSFIGLSHPGLAGDADGAYTLTWNSVGSNVQYHVDVSVEGGAFSTIERQWPDNLNTSMAFSAVPDGLRAYRVRACAGGLACASPSAAVTVRVARPPGTPTSFTLPGTNASGSFIVSWGPPASGSASRYVLERYGNGAWTTVQDSAALSFSQTGLTDGAYQFRVTACNILSCSLPTNSLGIQVIRTPSVPGALSGPSSSTSGAFTLTWGASATGTVTRYEVERTLAGSPTTFNHTTTSRSESNLPSGSYSYRVRACNSLSCSGFNSAKTVQVTRIPGTPGAISGPSTDPDGSFTVSWTAPSGSSVTSYKLQRAPSNTTNWQTIQSTAALSRNEVGLYEGVYWYRVQACNSAGCSSWTATKVVDVSRPVTSIAPYPTLSTNTVPGSLPLSMQIDIRGGLTMDLPLDIPRGVNGLGPQLSLQFNTLSLYADPAVNANNLWSLKGFSHIHVCDTAVPQYLCLSGEGMLVSENPERTSPPVGQRYRVRRQPGVLAIRQQDSSSASWYEVKRGGLTMRYGSSAATRKVESGGRVLAWYLDHVQDEFGNVMHIDYQSLSTGYLDKLPVLVRYGNYRVELVYNRITASASARVALHTIRSVVNGVTANEYRLIRSFDSFGNPIVSALQKCGYTTSGTLAACLPATTIETSMLAAEQPRVTVTDGLGAVSTVDFVFRRALSPQNGLMSSGEAPFPFADALSIPDAPFGQETEWVARSMSRSNGAGSTNTETYAYRFASLQNDVMRRQLPDGTYLYTSKLPEIGYFTQYFDQISKQARFTGVAGASGSRRLAYIENDWRFLRWDRHGGTRPLSDTIDYLFPAATRKHIIDDTGAIVGGEYTAFEQTWDVVSGLLSQTVATTTTGFDSSGQYISANLQRTSTRTDVLQNDATNWIVGFLSETRTESTVPGRSGFRGVRTSYSPYDGMATYKVGTMTVSGNSGAGYQDRVTTSTRYDVNGNVSDVTTSGSDFAQRSEFYSNYLDERYPSTVSASTGNGYTLQSTASYDRRHGVTSGVTDSNGLEASLGLDALGRIERRTSTSGAVVQFVYEPCSGTCGSARVFDRGAPAFRVRATTSHLQEAYKGAPTTVSYYDAKGRVIRVETEGLTGEWIIVDTVYNALGQLSERSLPYSSASTPRFVVYLYDLLGRVSRVTRPDGSYTSFAYAQSSTRYRVTQTERAVRAGGATRTTVRIEDYNTLGQLTSGTDANGTAEQVATTYQYDQMGLNDRVWVNGNTNTTVYTQHDAFGNALSIEDPNTGLTSYQYDGLGQLRYQTDASGVTTRFDYDLVGRMYRKVDDEGTANEVTSNWIYDTRKIGHLSSQSRPGFVEEYFYDQYSRVNQVTTNITSTGYSGSFTMGIGHDNYGRVTSRTYPSGFIEATSYNSYGYGNELRDGRTNTLLSRVDAIAAFGGVTQQTLGNGLQTVRGYDANTGLVSSVRTGTAGAIQNHTYTWWSNGLLHQRGRPGISATETFAYDGLNRVDTTSTVTPSGTRAINYDYDKLGNLTVKNEGYGSNVSSYVYATTKPHRLNTATVNGILHTYNYDANGNVTFDDAATGDDRTITFDVTGLPIAIVKGPAANPTARDVFKYGPDNTRYLKETLNRTTTTPVTDRTVYLYGGSYEVVMPGSGAVRSYEKTLTADVIHVRETSSGGAVTERFDYVHRDHLGSVDALTDRNGALVSNSSFDPFGGRRANNWAGVGTSPTLAFQHAHTSRGYTDHEQLDGTGLIHMNGRVFDPLLGRFMSADLIVQAPTHSQSYNRYAYVFNNPLSFSDLSGFAAGGASECAENQSRATDCPSVETVIVSKSRISERGRDASIGLDRGLLPGISTASPALCDAAGIKGSCYSASLVPYNIPFSIVGADQDDLYEILEEYADEFDEHQFDIVKDMLTAEFSLPGPEDASQVVHAGKSSGIFSRTARAFSKRAIAKGTRGEALVRKSVEIGKKTLITVDGRRRLPDGLNRAKRVLSEIKNVRYMHYSTQLRDYAQFAKANRMRFDLYVRTKTKLSPQLEKAWKDGDVNVIRGYLP